MDETQDEQTHVSRDATAVAAVDGVPVVEFAYHADLRRIGDRTRADALSSRLSPLTLGRGAPLFEPAEGGDAAPWGDVCISRSQLTVRWEAAREVFHVSGVEGARRALEPFDGPLPLGTRLDLEERATLLFTRRRVAPGLPRLGFVGESDAMWAVRDALQRFGASPRPVLVLGETGTGKELAARAVNACAGRPTARFRALNCASLPANLIESELFGHERGAFTGADRERSGLVGEAHGGTLFLDEIGDLSPEAQAKLLRFLDGGRYRRVGGLNELAADVKVVAATHHDLRRMVAAGTFREDLYYRLAALSVTMPPLRARRDDIPRLVVAYLHEAAARGLFTFEPATTRAPGLGRAFFDALVRHDWPGNVRQLRGVLERLVLLGPAAALAELAPPAPAGPTPLPARAPEVRPTGRRRPPGEVEIREALEAADFVKARAAAALGTSRNTLDKQMRALGIQSPSDLTDAELALAVARHGDDDEAIARALRVSLRGLKLRRARG